jgi:transcription elongation factor Elf1
MNIAEPSFMQEEYFFPCPYCGQEISMVFDLSVDRQTYVEDCEICCRPIEISYLAEEGEIISFEAHQLE